jgi:hypothetical protein
MSSQLERAATTLFPAEGGARVANVKFFRGRVRGAKADELADQLLRADAQVRNGLSIAVSNIDDEIVT